MTHPARTIKGARFCWQDKDALRRIREGVEDYGSAMAVYLALTCVSSDTGNEEFRTTHAWLASMSGFGERTVRTRLAELARLGLVEITTPPLRAPSTYRLLASGNGCQTSGNGCRAFGNGGAIPLPTSEEQKNRRTNTLRQSSTPAGKFVLESLPTGKAPRKQDPVFDALAELEGRNGEKLTDPAIGKVRKALALIRKVAPDVTPDEIRRRAGIYPLHLQNVSLTALALAGHWARCAHPPAPRPANGYASRKQIEALTEQVNRHPGNPEHVNYDRERVTPEQTLDFQTKRAELAQMKGAAQ